VDVTSHWFGLGVSARPRSAGLLVKPLKVNTPANAFGVQDFFTKGPSLKQVAAIAAP